MERYLSAMVKRDRFFEKLRDSSFRMELCIEGDIPFLFSGVSRTTKSNECYTMYTKENVVITLEDRHLPRKYSDMDIIGLP